MLPKDQPEDIAIGANCGQRLSAYALWCRNKNWLAKRRFFRRYWRVVREWPADRFLPTTDLDLSIDERSALARGIFDWRLLVPRYIDRFSDGRTDSQIYCFGVAHGQTVTELSSGFSTLSMALPHMHLFDSFQGLPQERSGIALPPIWHVGAYSEPSSTLKKKLESIGLHDYTLHNGWFKDTLDPLLVANGSFKPAVYVDIDADLYSSTIDILDFMFSHDLIRSGTLIGYDDWGNTDLWTAGESRAHKEVTAKYGASCAQLFSWGEPPIIRKLFLVI